MNHEATKCWKCKGTDNMCLDCLVVIDRKIEAREKEAKTKQTRVKNMYWSFFTLSSFWM